VRGFTLFEVMAAVLVLGILYTVLASTAIQGLRAEGESKRRLEASLLADEYVAEIEAGIAAGVFPELGTKQEEVEGGYQVVIEVVPFDPTPYLGEAFREQLPQPGDPTPSLLAPPAQPDQGLLRSVAVAVRWLEAEGEHEARRTTLAYDAATVASLFPADAEGVGGAQGSEGADTGGDELNPDGDPDVQRALDALRAQGAQIP
jgi:prepilin-type N-terminal cleavage/methylation domain-containing protein